MTAPPTPTEDPSHSVLNHAFTPEARQQLAEEDKESWYGVCGELITIVSGGLILGLIGVLCAIAMM
ncbi:MAG TPA: hypothetical protein VL096_09955 [Pirellulaceae bacterium]|nr:hypothetical protein [Pirellulaceae bacterium]